MVGQSHYTVDRVDPVKKEVYIRDCNDGGLSVTNDAEAVVKELNDKFPSYSIYYYDSEGMLDQLAHEDGVFMGFREPWF